MKNAKLGDGWIFNGYNLSNVARIEKRNDDGTYSVIYDATEQPTEQTVSALERIPKDEQGNPIYEMAENTDVAWDAIVEQTEGDEAMAQTVADSMLADKKAELKKAENAKSKGGATIAEKIASEKARQAAIDNAKANLDIWEKIAGTAKRRKAEAEAEQKRIAEEQKRIAEEARLAEEKRRVEEEAKRVEEARKAEEERLRAEQRELDENGRPFVVAPNGTTTFGEISEDTGLISAPIKLSEGYQDEDGKGYGLVHIEANHGEQIRKAGFASVEEFVSFVAKNYDKDNIRVGKRRDNARSTTYLIQVTDEHNNTLFVELSRDGSYWNVNSGGIFRKGYSNKKETVVKTEPQQPNNANSTSSSLSVEDKSGTSTTEPNGEPTVSTDKGTTKNETDKEVEEKIAEAEKEVDTNPTENQKLAGNYKKGHVNVEGYDVTIENPKGSVRRGTDKNGRQWEQKMNNTYGYIRGTQSVDGDHIDIFLSDNPTQGDVFVVDQVNEDGSFDEHKVMFGFNSLEEAKAAYLSNYEEGWKGLGTITQVSKEEFRKWIESSHRKTKPFAEYKSLNTKQKSTEDNKVDSKTKYLQAKDIIDEYIKTNGKSNMDDFNVLKKELTDDELNSLWLYLENQKKKSIQAVLFKSIINHELGTRKNAENTKEVEQQAKETDKETNDPLAEIEDKETYVEEQNKKGGEVKKKEEKAGNDALEGKEVKTKTKTETKQANKEATKQQTKNETIKEVAVEPTEKIEDVGEKIGGARKDIAVEFKQRAQEALEKSTDDLEEWIRETPISKIFNFDLQKLRESGMSNEVVSFIKICKQAIPAKPKLNRKLVSWAATTMKIYQMCLQAGTNWNEIKSLIDGSYSQASFAIMYQAYMAVGGFDSGLELNGAMLQQLGEVSVGYKNGEPYSLKGQWYISHAGSYGDIYETKEKAIEALMKFAGENAVPKGKKIEFVVYQRRNDGTCFITPKGKPGIIIQDGFKTSKEATDYRKEHGAELEERYRTLMTGTTAKFAENRDRKGRDYRGGKHVSAQEFMNTFGFRGVEFGNWTNQNDRQNSINEAYDALMDLADVLGVSPKALSLNGTLGMAFGARGQGKANAHYEPDKVVINLTKTKGHGALAHEWFHALDNYFASMVGVKGGYATDKNTLIPTNTWIRNKDGQFTYRDENGRELSGEELIKRFEDYGVRKEMAEAWVNLMDKVRQSDYYERSDKYAQLHGSKYLVEPTELGARAFSKWVENELSKRNATNDYLANNPALFAEELDDVVKEYTPYPFDIDATWMEEAFGALFSTMEQKTDENTGKVMLYHKADGTTEVLSDAETALRDALIGTLEGAGIEVITDNEQAQRVLDMANEGVRLEAKIDGLRNIRFFRTADGKAYGFTVDGKIYIDTTSAKADTPIHEYTHLWASAFRKNNPQEWSNIVELMKGTPEWEEVKKNYPELITDDEIADEVLAHYSGRRGAERLREEQQKVLDGNADVFEKASAVSAIARVKDALKRFWKGVAEWFNIHFTSAEEVADKVLADMLNGLNPNATDNIGTFDPNNADIRYSKDIDTNRGYTQRENGTYISNRALYAEEQGRFTKGTFAKNYGVSTKALEALEKLGVISASEWHHTGKNFNKSNFYSWQDDGTIVDGKYISYENGEALEGSVADKYAKNKKEIDKLAKEFENKEWEYKIPKPHLYSIPFFDNYANEQVPYSAYKLTDEEENRRESEHNLISKRGREDEWYLPRERRYDHLAVDEKYREIENKRKAQWIEEHRAELEQSYNNEYADKIDANNKVDAENATIDEYNQQTNGKEKVLERIAEILGVSPNIKAISTQEQIDIETNRRIEQSRMLDQQVREEMEKRREELKKWVDAQIKKGNITTFERVSKSDIPQNSAITKTEMNGKYGWFDATTRYNLPEYYSGYSFKTKSWLDKYNDKKKSANDFYAIRAELEPQYTNADNTESDEVRYRIREGEAPKKTGIGYKVFVLKDGQLYPPMVANPNGEATPVGVWLDADAAPIAGQSKTGRSQVKSGGKGTQGGSGKLAYRPGWHLGEIPYALQFNRQDENGERTLFPKNFVWAEVEYANDVDYQDEAMSYGYNQNGKFQHSLAGLPRVPENGAYTYRTNPNPETDPWIITGAMKVNRLLTPTEVDEMVRKVGREPQVRQEGAITDEEINALNEQIENVKRSTDETIQEINDRFNEELQQQIDGTLPKGHIYQMGMPSKILLSTGVPNLPIEMSATNLAEHAKKTRHPFELKDVKGLVNALQKPIAIFSYGDKTKSQNIIVEVQKDGRNFLVGIHFNQNRNGIEVSSIRGIFPKENSEWLNWINQNKLLYVNKEKIQTLIDQQRKNLADVEYLDLDSVAKVVQNFENPSIEEEKSSTNPLKMKERVEELAEKLNLGNVEIVTNVSQLNGKEKRAKGFFNKRTGKITIVLPNNANIADIEQTLLHEAVVHYGLRQIFGARFDTFLDNVFNNASEEVRRKIVALAAKNGWDFRTATEEYLASLAETTNFEEAQKEGWWKKVKQFFSDMLEQLGFKGFKGNASTDNELRYILWRSYENLKNGGANNNLFNEASDIAKQYELGVGQYANTGNDVMYRDGDPIQHERQLARARYEERMQNKWYQSKEAFQDSMLSLKEAMQAILGKQVRMEDVAGFENAYLGENRLSSVNKAEADAFAHTLFKPMLDEVAKLAPTQAERQELTKYMMALVLFFHYSFIKSL